MTFKHVKFQDSPVMRSLEKVAREKGMITQPALEKTASSKGFSSTGNLLADLLKLSEGLRSAGLVKQADDLEMKALAYKKAQTLYETSKEKGEDLVDAAHPDGGHKLEDVKNDEAVFETIVEQHLKNIDMVGKNPTGKLSKANDILGAVKKALGGTDDENAKVAGQLFSNAINEVSALASRVMRNEDLSDWTYHSPMNFGNLRDDEEAGTGVATGTTKGHMEVLLSNLNELAKKGPSQESVRELQRNINTLTSLLRDADNVNPVNRAKYSAEARSIFTKTPAILAALRGEGVAAAKPADSSADKIRAARMNLNGITALVRADTTADPQDVKDVTAWITRIDGALKDLESRAANMNPADIDATLAKLTKDFATVRQQWA